MRKIETKIGTMYWDYSNKINNEICWLLDNNKKPIDAIYNKECIKGLKEINSVGDLVDLLALQNCTWAQTIEDLVEEINDTYYSDEEFADERFSIEDMKEYQGLHKVGSTYFVVDFDL